MLKRLVILVTIGVFLLSGIAFGAEKELNVLVWIGYMAPSVTESFANEYGVNVNVKEYNTYEEMFNYLKTGEYDVVITGELVFPTLISQGMLEPLNKSLIPNHVNLDPLFKGLSFDPENTYSFPYHYIYIGLVYHKDRMDISDVTLQNYFEAPEELKGRISTFPDKRIMVSMAMKYMGQSMNNLDQENLDLVKLLLANVKENASERGLDINRSVVDPYNELLEGGADMAISYCAESTRRLFKANGVIGFVLPPEGAIIGTDNIAIAKNAKNIELAHKFINHLYNPEVAAKSINFFGNPFPVKGVRELINTDLANNPEIYPPANVVKNLEFFEPMTDEQLAKYDQVWKEAIGQ